MALNSCLNNYLREDHQRMPQAVSELQAHRPWIELGVEAGL